MAAFLRGCSAPPSQRVPSLRMDVCVVCNDQNRPSHGVYVFGPLLVLGILERQVTNLCVISYIQHLFDLSSDAELSGFVVGSLRPNGHAVLPVTHTEHGSADLVGLVKLFADQCQHRVQPPGVQYGLSPAALGHVDGPLPPLCAGRVFPFWLDPFFEEVEIRSMAQSARWDDIVVHTARHNAHRFGKVSFLFSFAHPSTIRRFESRAASFLASLFGSISGFVSCTYPQNSSTVANVITCRMELPQLDGFCFPVAMSNQSVHLFPRVRSSSRVSISSHFCAPPPAFDRVQHPRRALLLASFSFLLAGAHRPRACTSTSGFVSLRFSLHLPVFQRMLGEGLSAFLLALHFVGHGEMQHKHRHVAPS